jgi:hypothetical protein
MTVLRCLQRLDRVAHLLLPVVLVHGVVRRDQLTRTRVLLRRLSNRRAAVLDRVSIVGNRLLTNRCWLFVVRLLVVLVAVLLVHLHSRLVLVVVLDGLWLVRVWSLRRLHHIARRRSRVLVLILVLVSSVRRHLRVSSILRRSHLLVAAGGLVRLGHIIHAGTARRNQ